MGGLRGTENKLPKSSTPSGLSSCSLLITSPGIQRPIPSDSTAQSDSKALAIIPMKKQFRLLAIGQTMIYQCLKAQAWGIFFFHTNRIKYQRIQPLKAKTIPASSYWIVGFKVPLLRVNCLASSSFSLRQLSTASVYLKKKQYRQDK